MVQEHHLCEADCFGDDELVTSKLQDYPTVVQEPDVDEEEYIITKLRRKSPVPLEVPVQFKPQAPEEVKAAPLTTIPPHHFSHVSTYRQRVEQSVRFNDLQALAETIFEIKAEGLDVYFDLDPLESLVFGD